MEETNKKNEEFQTRREFLKKTAKGALPILGISLFGSALLEACEKDTDKYDSRRCSCSSTCSGSCDDSCSGNCDGCTGSCDSTGCTYM